MQTKSTNHPTQALSTDAFHATEADERAYLAQVREKLRIALDEAGGTVGTRFQEVMTMKRYLQESKTDMDHIEKAGVRESIDQMTRIGEHGLALAQRLSRLYQTPYFGRIDFTRADTGDSRPVYIGIHAFHDEGRNVPVIHDWRAPIAGMFYDFELGEAYFGAPDGRVEGWVQRKRQYRIKNGELVFMLETDLNIQDDVLQEELSRSADDRMRNIVATIQRDQNAIIRNDRTHALIIQGAAGSGKTSIALHRIAYLLYKFKDTIRSEDILILSPNKVFAHYIAQVLPELGEEMIQETTMEVLANYLLGYRVKFQTFAEQVAVLLEGRDRAYAERIRFKATPAFLDRLHAYATHVRNTNFRAHDLDGELHFVTAYQITKMFRQCGPMPIPAQVTTVTNAVVRTIEQEFAEEVSKEERNWIRKQIRGMLVHGSVKALYKDFYMWLGQPGRFKAGKGGVYEYADIFPLIYLSMLLEGETPHDKVKHLVIDEMQDYTPVQYQVLTRLFPCRKTILGDFHQSVNPLSASAPEVIGQIVPRSECMVLNKSYRSTVEIMALAQRVNCNEDLETIDRHGSEPLITGGGTDAEELAAIRARVAAFRSAGAHTTLGIITKTQAQATTLHQHLVQDDPDIQCLDTSSTSFRAGIIVTTAYLAKGLEFDEVIVPHVSQQNYCTEIDRHMLYVACTRAMHALALTHAGERSSFL